MKKVVVICCILAAFCLLVFAAGTKSVPVSNPNSVNSVVPVGQSTPAPKLTPKVNAGIVEGAPSESMEALKTEINRLEAAAQAAAEVNSDDAFLASLKDQLNSLTARYEALTGVAPSRPAGTLDTPGATCAEPFLITGAGVWTGTTCGSGFDYATTCLLNYDSGEDFIYKWTVTVAGQYSLALTSNSSWVGIAVDGACPLNAATCIVKATSSGANATIPCTQFAVGDYYIMLDQYATPNCMPSYTLTISQCVTDGRCCYGDPCAPTCVVNTTAECTALGGVWTMGGNCTNGCAFPPAGDLCCNAIPMTVPASIIGTTVGFANNYNYAPSGTNTAPDVVYSYTPSNDMSVTFSLCYPTGTSFDTYLYIYDNTCGGTPMRFDDDSCDAPNGAASKITCAPLVAGHTYYVVVDGYSANSGAYELTATECAAEGRCCYGSDPCNPTCVKNSIIDCNALGGVWTMGGNCEAGCPIPQVGELCCNAEVITVPSVTTASTVGFLNNYDFACTYAGTSPDRVYMLSPTEDQLVTFDLFGSEYDTKIFVYDTDCSGTPIACNDDYYADYTSKLECVPLLYRHTYFVVIDGYGSGSSGVFTLTTSVCEPCIPVPANDNCADVEPKALPFTFTGTNLCATADCGAIPTPSVWIAFYTEDACNIVLDYCGSVNTASGPFGNAYVNMVTSCLCEGITPNGVTNDTTCADGNMTITWMNLAAGTYYYPVMLDAANGADGDYVINVTCVPYVPQGRCCYGPELDPSCATNSEAECLALNGTWAAGLNCTTNPCPVPCVCTLPLDGRYCDMVGGPIADGPAVTTEFIINVPIEYHITDLNVCLDITHSYDGDLTIVLVSPLGTIVDLSSGNGGSGDNFTCTRFDDAAATSITAGAAPYTGVYKPEGLLSAFNGENAVGNWILRFTDCCAVDDGTLNWACLNFAWDIILPVQLVGFTATAGNNEVTLNWSTASETNNASFEIVRNGSLVGTVNSVGSAHNYSWVDNRTNNGTTYSYTLVGVSVSGERVDLKTVEATPSINSVVVTEYALHNNFPNPFNPTTDIIFDMKEAGNVSLKVYNLLGQSVATLANGSMEAGRHTVRFDAANLPSGLYICKMDANGFSAQSKMMLMK